MTAHPLRPAFDRAAVDALKRSIRLDQVARDYGLTLKPTGTDRFWAFCPFHNDRGRPNLLLDIRDPDNQHFHCFAGHCNAHGDVISFVMRLERLDFLAACSLLAQMPATPVMPTRQPRRPQPRRQACERHWEALTPDEQWVMNLACQHYHQVLLEHPIALRYLCTRQIPDWLIDQARLGYAHCSSLAQELEAHGPEFTATALTLGLVQRSPQGDLRDVLGGHIIVPELRDGHCIWFTGRSLLTNTTTHRYRSLAGSRPVLGRQWATNVGEVLVCEGVFDWLSALSCRLAACCTCGTHGTEPTAYGFLANATRIIGIFDPDPAGQAAADRFGLALGPRLRQRYTPLNLPDGTDLNALLCQPNGKSRFLALLEQARGPPSR